VLNQNYGSVMKKEVKQVTRFAFKIRFRTNNVG